MVLVLFTIAAWQIHGFAPSGHTLFRNRIAAATDDLAAEAAPNLQLGAITPTLTDGDGDSDIEPCETFELSIELDNVGGGAAKMISATLDTTTEGVTINSNSSAYPDFQPLSSAANTTPFSVTVGCDVRCGPPLEFELTVTFSGDTSPKTFYFDVSIGGDGSPQTFSYSGPPVPIPDGRNRSGSQPGKPAIATIIVSGFIGAIADIDFRIDGSSCGTDKGSTTAGIDHSGVSDLVIKLKSPRGTEITLIDQAGGDGYNFCQTVLDDEAFNPIRNVSPGQAPFSGKYKPDTPLDHFDGEDPNGTWTISVQDFYLGGTGNIRAFSLIITPAVCDAGTDLALTKTVSTLTALVGDQITYTLTVANNGSGTATNVVVTEMLPPEVSFVSCSATGDGVCGGSGNKRTITYSRIPGGAIRTITLDAKVIATGSFTNTATVVMDQEDPTPDDNTAVSGPVQSFDVCLQDEDNPLIEALADSATGAYQFCCNGIVYTGTGTVKKDGGKVTLTHNSDSRRVLIHVEPAANRGSATLKNGAGTCSITGRNFPNNTARPRCQ